MDERRKKFKYFPTAGNGKCVEHNSSEDEKARGKYPCPCCGNITLPVPKEEAIAYICHICFWENDVFTKSDDEPSDENHGMTLNEARINYKRFGACAERFARKENDTE